MLGNVTKLPKEITLNFGTTLKPLPAIERAEHSMEDVTPKLLSPPVATDDPASPR
jgi:hypothetical protein